ncbi:MAG TPA: helix-turn-helix domain-containing protein [Phycisphaerae bacterium]|nr:helix-turn-helix domain-containing protein [Phycisphaerae bacterium]
MNGVVFFPVPRGLAGHPAGPFWGYLRSRMGDDGGPAWPGQETIAADFATTEMTVRRWTRSLVAAGWLKTSRRPRGGRGHSIRYWAIVQGREDVEAGIVVPIRRKANTSVGVSQERATSAHEKANIGDRERATVLLPDKNQDEGGNTDKKQAGQPAAPQRRRAALEEETDPARLAVALALGVKRFHVYLDDLAIRNTDGYTIEVPDRTRAEDLERRFGAVLRSELGQVRFVVTVTARQEATACA